MATALNTNEIVTLKELMVTALATADVVAKLLIDKGLISEKEFMEKLQQERVTYQHLLNPTAH